MSAPPPERAPLRSRVVEKSPVHYGWVILAAGTFGMIMTTPGQTLGISVFLDRIILDLGATRSQVSLTYTLATLAGAMTLPFVGRFIDRRGPRRAVVLISAAFALACVWMGFVQGLWTLALGFLLLRGLGQGALSLASVHIINIWFVRRRGMAVGIAGIGVAAATAFFPLLIEGLIGRFDWRIAYMLLGGIVALTILPIGALLFRSHPERFGLEPDGRARGLGRAAAKEAAFTVAQARRTGIFWLFTAGDFWISALGTGLIFHHFSIMSESGLDRIAAATVFIPLAFVTAGTGFAAGMLVDRVSPRILLIAALLFQSAALLMATRVDGPDLILVYDPGRLTGDAQRHLGQRLRPLLRPHAHRGDQGPRHHHHRRRDVRGPARVRARHGVVRGVRRGPGAGGDPARLAGDRHALRAAAAGGRPLSRALGVSAPSRARCACPSAYRRSRPRPSPGARGGAAGRRRPSPAPPRPGG